MFASRACFKCWFLQLPPVDPGARPAASDQGPAGPAALAAPRPGPRGPGTVSSGRADVAGSGRTGPGLAHQIGSQTVQVSARRATSPTHRAERAAPRAAALPPVRSRGNPRGPRRMHPTTRRFGPGPRWPGPPSPLRVPGPVGRAGLYGSSGRPWLRMHRARGPGLGIGSQTVPVSARRATSPTHLAERATTMGRCAAAGAVTWRSPGPASGPAPLGLLWHGGRRGTLSLLSRLLYGSIVVSAPMASRSIAECGSTGAVK